LLLSRRGKATILPWCPEIADNKHRAKPPEDQAKVALSEQNCQFINGYPDMMEG
jgi:hypothetical protein